MGIGTYVNNSGSNNGYGNFTSSPVPLLSGTSYTLSLRPGFSGKSRPEYWRVWIDYNKDGDFLDSGELVFSANNQKNNVSGTITIPAGLTGDTRMRVSMKYNSAPSPCENFNFGEVEDYKLSLSIPSPLIPLTDFTPVTASVSVENNLKFDIYPNPATEILNAMWSGNSEKVHVRIYNLTGQIIYEFVTTNNGAVLSLSGYEQGIYYIGIDDGIHNALKKFIKE